MTTNQANLKEDEMICEKCGQIHSTGQETDTGYICMECAEKENNILTTEY